LAGISKIFKDKPKDEDAALPEKEIRKAEKKQAKQDKKDRKKASAAPATVSHATVEQDKPINDDDRALAGLSPAAKLARQHTLRSKAEQQKAQAEKARTGEPTWDNNTQTRNTAPVLPSIESLTSGLSTLTTSTPENGPEVVRVQPRSTRVVHAVNVADHEYDSEDDSSDGETVEDATISMARTRFSQETERSLGGDDEFRAEWGNSWIDKTAVPKKGILKRESLVSILSSHKREEAIDKWIKMANWQNIIPTPKVRTEYDPPPTPVDILLLAPWLRSHLQTQLRSTV
jgi:hypothetical protein